MRHIHLRWIGPPIIEKYREFAPEDPESRRGSDPPATTRAGSEHAAAPRGKSELYVAKLG
jgi:hypothetical protein